MSIFITLIAALIVFSAVIAIHEFGHFTVAKLCGIQVNEFSIGMGPALWKKIYKGTQYSLRALPVGGYLALEDQPFTSEEASKVWLTMAHEGGGLNRGLLEYGKFPAHTFFGELYTDREYTQFFLFPFERVPGEDDGTSTYVAGSSVYVAPAASLDEAKALLESYGLMESHGLPIPDESPQ